MAAGSFLKKLGGWIKTGAEKVWDVAKKPLEVTGRILSKAAPVLGGVIGSADQEIHNLVSILQLFS